MYMYCGPCIPVEPEKCDPKLKRVSKWRGLYTAVGVHSQERPPSLMWPEIFVATTMNAFTSPSRQRPPI